MDWQQKDKLKDYAEADALNTFDTIVAIHEKIRSLKQEANELIENHIPQRYQEGDKRAIPATVYAAVVRLLEVIRVFEGSKEQGQVVPVFIGPFGTLYIVKAEEAQ